MAKHVVWICSGCASRNPAKIRPFRCKVCGARFVDVTELKEAKVKPKKVVVDNEFNDRVAAQIVANRQLGRAMPGKQEALEIMEWAFESSDAEEAAPEDVANYRTYFDRPWVDDAHWRTAYDLALEIWEKAHKEHVKKQAVF